MHPETDDWTEYLKKLENASGVRIDSFETLKEALKKRMLFFHVKVRF